VKNRYKRKGEGTLDCALLLIQYRVEVTLEPKIEFVCHFHCFFFRASLGLILTLFLSTLSRGDDGDHHGSPSFHQPEFHSIPLDLRPLQLSNFRSKQDNNRTNNVGEGLKAFTFEYSPGIPNASQGTGDIGKMFCVIPT